MDNCFSLLVQIFSNNFLKAHATQLVVLDPTPVFSSVLSCRVEDNGASRQQNVTVVWCNREPT